MAKKKLVYVGPNAQILKLPSWRKVQNPHLLSGKKLEAALEQNPELAIYFKPAAEAAAEATAEAEEPQVD